MGDKKKLHERFIFWLGIAVVGIPLVFLIVHGIYPVSGDNVTLTNISAGDLLGFIGGFLTFIGTSYLGIVAITQNKRSNDALNKSNDISIINKIITIEKDRINEIENLLSEFTLFCNPNRILVDNLTFTGADVSAFNTSTKVNLIGAQNRIKILKEQIDSKIKAYNNFRVDNNYVLDLSLISDSTESFIFFHIEQFSKSDRESAVQMNESEISGHIEQYRMFCNDKEKLCNQLNNGLNKIIISNMTLEDIKKLYSV